MAFLLYIVYNIYYMKNYPEWVLAQKRPGTTIRQVKDNYYLYTATSKYSKDKKYPVTIQRYVGKITPDGLIEQEKVSFIPTKDKLALLKDVVSLNAYNVVDLASIENLPVMVIDGNYYTGVISIKIEKILLKHLDYKEGIIYG